MRDFPVPRRHASRAGHSGLYARFRVTGVDWIIVGLVLLLALFGWAQGFVSGVLAFAGLALGAWLGTRIGPLVLSEGSKSPWAPGFGLLGALLVGAALAGLFEAFGAPVRSGLRRVPGFGAADGILGAILIACVGLGVVWILGALAVQSGTYRIRMEVQRSAILQRLNTVLPPSGPLLNSLRRLDPFPRIEGPEARVAPPQAGIARDPEVQEAAGERREGAGHGVRPRRRGLGLGGGRRDRRHERARGGGRARHAGAARRARAGPAGARRPLRHAQRPGHPPRRRARRAGARAHPEPEAGTSAAILGFPLNGPFDVRPGRIGATRRVSSSDAYGDGPVQRSMTALRGLVRSGNSGGPMVDGDGRVVTTVFAATTRGPRGGYGVPNSVVRRALPQIGGEVSTGDCTG